MRKSSKKYIQKHSEKVRTEKQNTKSESGKISAFTEYRQIISEFVNSHLQNKTQIWEMAKTDIVKTYRGAVLGWAWAIIKPAIRIFIYWFAIAIGLRAASSHEDVSYFAFLISGMIPWFYMSDLITGGPRVIRKYGYLVTKLRFPIMTIPTFFSLSNLLVHLFMLVMTIGVLAAQGYPPNIYMLQLPFYMLVMFIFFNSWSLFSGMLGAISKDFINLIASINMMFFWLSGIIFDINAIGDKHPGLLELMNWNPITVIVNGYRDSLVYKEWFWEKPDLMLHLLIVFVVMFILSFWSYKKLRKDIADVI